MPGSELSARARHLGLRTADDVMAEFEKARQGWSTGTLYHCPFCDKDFTSAGGARKHMKAQHHHVLRWDWYGDLGKLPRHTAERASGLRL